MSTNNKSSEQLEFTLDRKKVTYLTVGTIFIAFAFEVFAIITQQAPLQITASIASVAILIIALLGMRHYFVNKFAKFDHFKAKLDTETIALSRINKALDKTTTNVMISDENYNIVYINDSLREMFLKNQDKLRESFSSFDVNKLIGVNMDIFHKNPDHQRGMLKSLSTTFQTQIATAGRKFSLIANPILNEQGQRIGIVIEWKDRTEEAAIEHEIEMLLKAAGSGVIDKRLELENKEGFIKAIASNINTLLEVIEQIISDASSVMKDFSVGNLDTRIHKEYDGVFQTLKNDINQTGDKISSLIDEVSDVMKALSDGNLRNKVNGEYSGTYNNVKVNINATIENLTNLITNIRRAASLVNTGGIEVSQGSSDLQKRTESQASALEETSASMEEISASITTSAENAKQANDLSGSAKDKALKGQNVVSNVVQAMSAIKDSSSKIVEIIGVIDDIAFQTNLLALNAAVEAARAGEQGKGFAVVAAEVRNLAQRSATSAREIKELIQDSVSKVEEGTSLANDSGDSLNEILQAVEEVNETIESITKTTIEQADSVGQINSAVANMDNMTQQNSALVEELTAASIQMRDQSQVLMNNVDAFNIEDRPSKMSPETPRPAGRADSSSTLLGPKSTPTPPTKSSSIQSPGASDEEMWESF